MEKCEAMDKKTVKEKEEMIEENGHRWIFTSRGFDSNERCVFCGMRYNYYLNIKSASQEQPDREDLKEWLKCKGRKK